MLPMMEMAFLLSCDVAQLRNKHHAIEASDDNVSSKLQLLTSDLQALAAWISVLRTRRRRRTSRNTMMNQLPGLHSLTG